MSKVIQIRGVPDDVHAKLVEAAGAAGLSLTAFLVRELERLARQADSVRQNREVIMELRRKFGAREDDGGVATVKALHEGRAERDQQLARATGRRGR